MKGKNTVIWLFAALLLAGWGVEWRRSLALQTERAEWQRKQENLGRPRMDASPQVAEKADKELRRLRDERDAVQQLRWEIELMQRRVDDRARSASTGVAIFAPERELSILDDFVSAARWKNPGRDTPENTLQTALWAAAGGDLKELAGTLVLDDKARAKAHALLDRLPPEVRTQFHYAEEFIALLTTTDVPLTEAHLLDLKIQSSNPRVAFQGVDFRNETPKPSTVVITLWRLDNGEWRLLVPEAAVDKYTAMLLAPRGDEGSAAAPHDKQ